MKGYGDMGGKMRDPNRLFATERINPPTVSPVTFSRREPVAFKLPQKHAKIKKSLAQNGVHFTRKSLAKRIVKH